MIHIIFMTSLKMPHTVIYNHEIVGKSLKRYLMIKYYSTFDHLESSWNFEIG